MSGYMFLHLCSKMTNSTTGGQQKQELKLQLSTNILLQVSCCWLKSSTSWLLHCAITYKWFHLLTNHLAGEESGKAWRCSVMLGICSCAPTDYFLSAIFHCVGKSAKLYQILYQSEWFLYWQYFLWTTCSFNPIYYYLLYCWNCVNMTVLSTFYSISNVVISFGRRFYPKWLKSKTRQLLEDSNLRKSTIPIIK